VVLLLDLLQLGQSRLGIRLRSSHAVLNGRGQTEYRQPLAIVGVLFVEKLNRLQVVDPGGIAQVSNGDELGPLAIFADLAVGIAALTVLHQEGFDFRAYGQP
jgi:hypothetical protein